MKRLCTNTNTLYFKIKKQGWFEIFCPGSVACNDDGEFFTLMVIPLEIDLI